VHLQQTKVGSRSTGGPQYYFHNVDDPVKDWLRKRGACPVVLRTPYGIVGSPFMAVSQDRKLSAGGQLVRGGVGHDRIQGAGGRESIGEAIRRWYGLKKGDFENIEVEVSIHKKGHFILVPTAVTMRGGRTRVLERDHAPLTFHHDYQSRLWKDQIRKTRKESPSDVEWAASQIARVVAEHRNAKGIHEVDLLRSAGALALLGLQLSPYLLKGYDCQRSEFRFLDLPEYQCPVEIKRQSKGFKYQMSRYKELPRAVVLCIDHDLRNPPEHVDVIELSSLARRLVG
jgi:hypothetical protein